MLAKELHSFPQPTSLSHLRALLSTLEEPAFARNARLYVLAIEAAERCGSAELVEAAVRQSLRHGIALDLPQYTIALRALSRAGRPQVAESLLHDIAVCPLLSGIGCCVSSLTLLAIARHRGE